MGDCAAEGPRPGFRSALAHRELRWFVAHHLVAGTGQSFGTVAVATVIYDRTGSATWVGLAAAARLLPYLACSGPAGVLADRIDRRRLLVGSSVLRAVAVVALAAAVWFGLHPVVLVGLVFAGTALGTASFPAMLAVVPSVVRPRDLPAATAIVNTVETAVWLVGPALGGLLVLLGTPVWALAVNAAIFVVGVVTLLPTRPRPVAIAGPHDAGFVARLVEGAGIVGRTAVIRCPLVLVVAVNLVVGAAPILLLLHAQGSASGGNAFAWLTAAMGAGGFSGVVLTNRMARREDVIATLTWSTAAGCLPFAALSATDHLVGAMALVAIGGGALVVTEVVGLTVMLRELPDQVIGRVFGLVDSILVATVLLGSLLAAPLVAMVGLPVTLVGIGTVLPLVAAFGSRWLDSGSIARPTVARA